MPKPNFNGRNLKARTLSPRDEELSLFLKSVADAVSVGQERMVVTDNETSTESVYDTRLLLESFAVGYRGSLAVLLQSVERRGGLLGKYKKTGIGIRVELESVEMPEIAGD